MTKLAQSSKQLVHLLPQPQFEEGKKLEYGSISNL